MNKLFLGDVSGYSVEELIEWVSENFVEDKGNLSKYEFLVAQVNEDSYDGWSYFLVKNQETSEFFEVNASHCSCMGYEDQWQPKIASRVYLQSEQYMPGYKEVQNFVRSLFN